MQPLVKIYVLPRVAGHHGHAPQRGRDCLPAGKRRQLCVSGPNILACCNAIFLNLLLLLPLPTCVLKTLRDFLVGPSVALEYFVSHPDSAPSMQALAHLRKTCNDSICLLETSPMWSMCLFFASDRCRPFLFLFFYFFSLFLFAFLQAAAKVAGQEPRSISELLVFAVHKARHCKQRFGRESEGNKNKKTSSHELKNFLPFQLTSRQRSPALSRRTLSLCCSLSPKASATCLTWKPACGSPSAH